MILSILYNIYIYIYVRVRVRVRVGVGVGVGVCVCACVCALVFFERKPDRARIAVTYAELKCHKHKLNKAARNEQSF